MLRFRQIDAISNKTNIRHHFQMLNYFGYLFITKTHFRFFSPRWLFSRGRSHIILKKTESSVCLACKNANIFDYISLKSSIQLSKLFVAFVAFAVSSS